MEHSNTSYWINKIHAWTNESICKIFDIPNRNEIAKDLRSAIISSNPTDEEQSLINIAEHIASGLTRAALPNDEKVVTDVVLKHPLVKNKGLTFKTPITSSEELKTLVDEIKELVKSDLDYTKDMSEEEKYKEIFNYIFFALNKRLRNTKEGVIGKVGALWDILPADTRMPDHPMWHHFGLTSSIYSSLAKNSDTSKENLSVVVYSITPVQDFIMKARKLRDYWTGSVILSYLAFMGITAVIETLGPDHILYPSLHNQALMEQWLTKKNDKYKTLLKDSAPVLDMLNNQSKSIASFPNKFVFICNNKDVGDICNIIEETIDNAWKDTANIVRTYIAKKTDSISSKEYNDIWDRTLDKYWKYSWAATNFATINNEEELKALLPTNKWEDELEAMKKFEEFFKKKENPNYDVSNLYGATHSLAQGLLAAGKNKPIVKNIRNSQNGMKCPLCGEGEVLNNSLTNIKASDYRNNITTFWNTLRQKVNGKDVSNFSQVGEKECLCAVCALKRFLPIAIKDNHLLYSTLKDSIGFPSTTELSSHEFLKTVPENDRKKIVDSLHENELTNDDKINQILKGAKNFETKYYAFLLMDGDKMGDLINGETTEASWKDVINFQNVKDSPFSDDKFASSKRKINPALHSMISDSLNNFARYGVQPLVNNFGEGKLIYAGGDDVCAILPLSTAFETADKIRQVYSLSYAKVTENGSKALLKGEQGLSEDVKVNPNMDKIVMHLGNSDNQDKTKISLSGAIIIAHHKQPLKEIIMDAHKVLDGVAKEKSGRNSLAIRLKKRSGGSRDVWFKWEEVNCFSSDNRTCKDSYLNVMKSAGVKELSTSLLYKLQELKGYVEPLTINKDGNFDKDVLLGNKDKILKLFEYELSHSGYKNNAQSLAVDIAGICIKPNASINDWYNAEAAVIANFMGNNTVNNEEEESND